MCVLFFCLVSCVWRAELGVCIERPPPSSKSVRVVGRRSLRGAGCGLVGLACRSALVCSSLHPLTKAGEMRAMWSERNSKLAGVRTTLRCSLQETKVQHERNQRL